MAKEKYTIGIDFDGTIVEHEFPHIGKPVPLAIETMKELQSAGHKLILHTMRSHKPTSVRKGVIDDKTGKMIVEIVKTDTLQEAVDFCKNQGITFYGVNINPTQKFWTSSPKTYAEIYIDDAAVGCPLVEEEGKRPYVDWVEIRKLLSNKYGLL